MRERIRQVMDSMGLSQQEFAQKLGISPASLSNIFNGRSNPTNNHVQAIHRAFPNINTNWLMFGEGTMLNDDAKKSSDSGMPDSASGSLNSNSNLPGGNNGSSKNEIGGFGLFDGISNPVVGNSNQEKQVATKVITETKIVRPKVVEIRVFYDDQTFESFVPSEKHNVSR